jgi:hypothetical protein
MCGTNLTIACDESGAEGENLVGAADRVFTYASVDLSIEEADQVLAELRAICAVESS